MNLCIEKIHSNNCILILITILILSLFQTSVLKKLATTKLIRRLKSSATSFRSNRFDLIFNEILCKILRLREKFLILIDFDQVNP